jgi:hypothetical protein
MAKYTGNTFANSYVGTDAANQITLQNVQLATLTAADFLFT